jgi:hypothetical protein
MITMAFYAYVLLVVGLVIYTFFSLKTHVQRVLVDNGVSADKVTRIQLVTWYNKLIDDGCTLSQTIYTANDEATIRAILEGLRRTKIKIPGTDLISNAELRIDLCDGRSLEIEMVLDKHGRPAYIGPDYALPAPELRTVIGKLTAQGRSDV